MRILMIANYLPYPPRSGGRIRIYNLLRRIAARHEVAFAALLESPEDAEGVAVLRQFCAAVETAPLDHRSRAAKLPGVLRYGLTGKPPELVLLHSQELVGKIAHLCSRTVFDIVQIESVMGLYLEALPRRTGACRTIAMFQNVSADQLARIADVERNPYRRLRTRLQMASMRSWEPRYAEKFDRCATVSDLDRQLLAKANPRLHIDVVPNGVDIEKFQQLPPPPRDAAPSLLFIGHMGYPPCADAALYFCNEILPIIRRVCPTIQVSLVGGNPPSQVLKLNGPGVHVTGLVADVVPYYQQSTVCIVPLRAGGGTRLKILEAMALGRAVVSTTVGCEGLDVVDGEHLLVADTPDEFARATVRLLQDPALRQSLCANARRLVESRYDWDGIASQLMAIYEDMLAKPTREVPGAR